MNKIKKTTVATVKAFIRKNRSKLLIKVLSSFDGMQEMIVSTGETTFKKIEISKRWNHELRQYVAESVDNKNNMGLCGIWFTGGDRCQPYESDVYVGFEVYNSCSEWIVAIAK